MLLDDYYFFHYQETNGQWKRKENELEGPLVVNSHLRPKPPTTLEVLLTRMAIRSNDRIMQEIGFQLLSHCTKHSFTILLFHIGILWYCSIYTVSRAILSYCQLKHKQHTTTSNTRICQKVFSKAWWYPLQDQTFKKVLSISTMSSVNKI